MFLSCNIHIRGWTLVQLEGFSVAHEGRGFKLWRLPLCLQGYCCLHLTLCRPCSSGSPMHWFPFNIHSTLHLFSSYACIIIDKALSSYMHMCFKRYAHLFASSKRKCIYYMHIICQLLSMTGNGEDTRRHFTFNIDARMVGERNR